MQVSVDIQSVYTGPYIIMSETIINYYRIASQSLFMESEV